MINKWKCSLKNDTDSEKQLGFLGCLVLVVLSVFTVWINLNKFTSKRYIKELNMGHFACNTPYMSWVKVLFLGELKDPGDSTGLEWGLHLSSYFCGVTWYSSLAFFMYLLFKFIPHEYRAHLSSFLAFFPSLSFSESLSVGSPAAPVCHCDGLRVTKCKPPYFHFTCIISFHHQKMIKRQCGKIALTRPTDVAYLLIWLCLCL